MSAVNPALISRSVIGSGIVVGSTIWKMIDESMAKFVSILNWNCPLGTEKAKVGSPALKVTMSKLCESVKVTDGCPAKLKLPNAGVNVDPFSVTWTLRMLKEVGLPKGSNAWKLPRIFMIGPEMAPGGRVSKNGSVVPTPLEKEVMLSPANVWRKTGVVSSLALGWGRTGRAPAAKGSERAIA